MALIVVRIKQPCSRSYGLLNYSPNNIDITTGSFFAARNCCALLKIILLNIAIAFFNLDSAGNKKEPAYAGSHKCLIEKH